MSVTDSGDIQYVSLRQTRTIELRSGLLAVIHSETQGSVRIMAKTFEKMAPKIEGRTQSQGSEAFGQSLFKEGQSGKTSGVPSLMF